MDTVESAEYGEGSEQFKFIESALKNNSELEKPAPLVIVMMHKPMVSCTCKHPNDEGDDDEEELPEADTYHPLFKKFGVDLVLQGHNHNVQYYEPIDGVMYILSGSGGAGKHEIFNNQKLPRDFPDDAGDISIKYKEWETIGFTLLEANFDTFELKGSLISNQGTPMSGSNFTMKFVD
jgi:3',5'-cyclic AMP phosphodiesterase CpdA